VLIVEDIVDTGRTMQKLLTVLKGHQPKTIRVARYCHISSINANSLIIQSPDFSTKLIILLPLNNSIKFEHCRTEQWYGLSKKPLTVCCCMQHGPLDLHGCMRTTHRLLLLHCLACSYRLVRDRNLTLRPHRQTDRQTVSQLCYSCGL